MAEPPVMAPTTEGAKEIRPQGWTSAHLTVIEPRRGLAGLGLTELWAYRELLFFFIWRDLKVRYRQTVFGVLWAVIQPLALMLVFTAFLGRVPGLGEEGVPYPLFALAGLIPWTFFAQGISGSATSLVDASNLVQKVYFPRLLLPLAAIGSHILDFVIALALLVIVLVSFGFPPSGRAVWIIPLTGLAIGSSAAFGIFLAGLNVKYRDVRHAMPFLIQLWLFASPIAYAAGMVPSQWLGLYYLNPIAGLVEGFRWAIFANDTSPIPLGPIAASTIITAVVLIASLAYFRVAEQTFADVI